MENPIPEQEFNRLLELADQILSSHGKEESKPDLNPDSEYNLLIDGMGGTLKIDSKLGEYSKFEVMLPV